MKRKTLPKARHFSEVESRLRVGGRAAKESPTPHFSRPHTLRAVRAAGLYKVAGAGRGQQLCSAARVGKRIASPAEDHRPAARLASDAGRLDGRAETC